MASMKLSSPRTSDGVPVPSNPGSVDAPSSPPDRGDRSWANPRPNRSTTGRQGGEGGRNRPPPPSRRSHRRLRRRVAGDRDGLGDGGARNGLSLRWRRFAWQPQLALVVREEAEVAGACGAVAAVLSAVPAQKAGNLLFQSSPLLFLSLLPYPLSPNLLEWAENEPELFVGDAVETAGPVALWKPITFPASNLTMAVYASARQL